VASAEATEVVEPVLGLETLAPVARSLIAEETLEEEVIWLDGVIWLDDESLLEDETLLDEEV
jgi:hypothetical protein